MPFLLKGPLWILRMLFFVLGWLFELIQRAEDRLIRLFKKPEYERKGGCQKTGICCSNLGIQLPASWMKRPWLVRYFIWWHRYRYNFHYHDRTDTLLIYHCAYLTKNNTCSIYKWRPRLCREYPQLQLWGFPKLHKGCGFYFAKRGQKDFREMLYSTTIKN
jgi:Fe-S-cluster containining protein